MLDTPSSFAGKEDPLEKQRGRRMAVGATAAKAENAANAGGGTTTASRAWAREATIATTRWRAKARRRRRRGAR